MTNRDDKVIKNPLRSIPKTQTPYEPEHIRMGIKVPDAPANTFTQTAPVAVRSTRKRDPNPPMQEVYAVDEINVDFDGNEVIHESGHIIDNNDFVDLRYGDIDTRAQETEPEPQEPLVENAAAPQVGDYILMVLGKLISTGSIDKVEKRVREIMYSEDKSFGEVSIDDIVVLKRVNIKIGIFVGE